MDFLSVCEIGEVTNFRGFECYVHSTMHGDGDYLLERENALNYARSLSVDSGMLGILPVELVRQLGHDLNKVERLMAKRSFETDFQVGCIDGRIEFGDLAIDTSDLEAEEEHEDEPEPGF